MSMNVSIKENKLVIVIDLQEKVSASGKSLIIATSGGNKTTEVTYKDKPVVIGLNAYVSTT